MKASPSPAAKPKAAARRRPVLRSPYHTRKASTAAKDNPVTTQSSGPAKPELRSLGLATTKNTAKPPTTATTAAHSWAVTLWRLQALARAMVKISDTVSSG